MGEPNAMWIACDCHASTKINAACANCGKRFAGDYAPEGQAPAVRVEPDDPSCPPVTLYEHLGLAQLLTGLKVTEVLPWPLPKYEPPVSVAQLQLGGPSPLGWSVSSTMLECPERGRLYTLGVRRKSNFEIGDELDRLLYGSLMHAALAYRWTWSQDAALSLIETFEGLHPEDKLKAIAALKIYDMTYPREAEPFAVLGIEALVVTDIGDGNGRPLFLTVRYDAVVKPIIWDQSTSQWTYADHVLSLERKTTASGGETTMASYTGQFYTQVACWNANPALVKLYGPMVGVIGDLVTKHVVPRCERIGPRYISRAQQDLAIAYHRQKAHQRHPVDERGRLPRMLHACQGRYGACDYFSLCHEDAFGLFEQRPAVAA